VIDFIVRCSIISKPFPLQHLLPRLSFSPAKARGVEYCPTPQKHFQTIALSTFRLIGDTSIQISIFKKPAVQSSAIGHASCRKRGIIQSTACMIDLGADNFAA